VFTCPWSTCLKVRPSQWMSTHFWTLCTLSWHDVLSLHHHDTPASICSEFQGWKCYAYRNCVTPQSFLHGSTSNVITTAHQCISQIAQLTDCCTICCMLPLL
jgi:hypothetical protein